MFTNEEGSLLFVATGYIGAAVVWVLVLRGRVRILLRRLRRRDPALWAELGSPETARDVLKDPEKRWNRFVASGEYRRRLGTEGIDEVDDFRRRTRVMLFVLAAAGVLVVVRYWSLLKPDFL